MFQGTIRNLNKDDKVLVEEIFDLYWNDEFRRKLSKRLNEFIDDSPEIIKQDFQYFIAEENKKILGIIGIRKCPDLMIQYTKTINPLEIYILAVKNKGNGIGRQLVEKVLKEGKDKKYTEAVLYSGETHKDSWSFYDHLGFEKVGPSVAPDGERGHVWSLKLYSK